jgi:hypothetical protein
MLSVRFDGVNCVSFLALPDHVFLGNESRILLLPRMNFTSDHQVFCTPNFKDVRFGIDRQRCLMAVSHSGNESVCSSVKF